MSLERMSAGVPIQTSASWRVEQVMGMPIEVDVRDGDVDPLVLEAALAAVFDWLREVDAMFSTYRVDSQISRLNAGGIVNPKSSETVARVLQLCDQICEETDGYFSIETDRLPLELRTSRGGVTRQGVDPSGFVKGWSVDRAGEILEVHGIHNYTINAGGDIRTRGAALPDSQWKIGIRHPLERVALAAVVVCNDLAIATSAEYERGRHIIDPHTGLPPEGLLSVTIVGPDLGRADAYATAAFAMGDEGPRWTMGLTAYESLTILSDRTVLSTPGFPKE
jgi:thiamine biosynthesis lipoprotein